MWTHIFYRDAVFESNVFMSFRTSILFKSDFISRFNFSRSPRLYCCIFLRVNRTCGTFIIRFVPVVKRLFAKADVRHSAETSETKTVRFIQIYFRWIWFLKQCCTGRKMQAYRECFLWYLSLTCLWVSLGVSQQDFKMEARDGTDVVHFSSDVRVSLLWVWSFNRLCATFKSITSNNGPAGAVFINKLQFVHLSVQSSPTRLLIRLFGLKVF